VVAPESSKVEACCVTICAEKLRRSRQRWVRAACSLAPRGVAKFTGVEVTVGEVENFVVDDTPFRETHYKGVLRELEKAVPPLLSVVDALPTRKKGTFPDPRLRVRFA
jgi:hypothetical protein